MKKVEYEGKTIQQCTLEIVEKLKLIIPTLTEDWTEIDWKTPELLFTECWINTIISYYPIHYCQQMVYRRINYAIKIANLPIKVKRKQDHIFFKLLKGEHQS